MKRCLVLVALILFLAGCASTDDCINRGMALRERLLQSEGCSFRANITADYTDLTFSFVMDCQADREGNLTFAVVEPESISGITGTIMSSGGQLTFDDIVLAFPLLADGEVSPVSAPWLLIKTLRSGYLSSCTVQSEQLRLTIDDSYEADALQLDIWLGHEDLPETVDILWQGRRVLSLQVEDFAFM